MANSVSSLPQLGPPGRPFQCPSCFKRFTRYENLKRHTLIHQESHAYRCPYCPASFSRPDLRRRHVNKVHLELLAPAPSVHSITAEGVKLGAANGNTDSAASGGSGGLSGSTGWGGFASLQVETGEANGEERRVPAELDFIYDSLASNPIGPGRGSRSSDLLVPGSSSSSKADPTPSPSLINTRTGRGQLSTHTASPSQPARSISNFLSSSTISLGLELFTEKVLPTIPFIHRPTFSSSTLPDPLLLALLSLSLPLGPDGREGHRQGSECAALALRLVEEPEPGWSALVQLQTLLLLQTRMMTSCNENQPEGEWKIRAKAIDIARREGMMDPLPSRADQTPDITSLWENFIRIETHKRTLYQLYHIDATWYHLLSLPRDSSHLEIKHELPCPEPLWTAPSAAAWAHRLILDAQQQRRPPPENEDHEEHGRDSYNPPNHRPRFIETIQACMSVNPEKRGRPRDAYGAMMVTLYIWSCVKEVSGWSTMTGRLCIERFEALHAGLLSLEPVLNSTDRPDRLLGTIETEAEATFRITMIELLLWDPSHTNGLVETSLRAAIISSVHLCTTRPIQLTAPVADLLEPHIAWFLVLLTTLSHSSSASASTPSSPAYSVTSDIRALPAWVTVYALKAVLVAWQMAKQGLTQPLKSIGLENQTQLEEWMRKVFGNMDQGGPAGVVLSAIGEL